MPMTQQRRQAQSFWELRSCCCLCLIGVGMFSRSASANLMDPLRGEYGFLTKFGGISADDARLRVRSMCEVFNIFEFQFYDALEHYSWPPAPGKDCWHNPFGQEVCRSILKAYVQEIQHLGGRSWLYVQAMGTDPQDTNTQNGFAVAGQHLVDGRPLLDVVVPTAAWAEHIAARWADFAAEIGFSGIHWDTLGDKYGVAAMGGDVPGFLRASRPVLMTRGLEQTCNFVDGFGWEPSLFGLSDCNSNTVAFPYWEAWSLPTQEDHFFKEVAPLGGGVFVCYPGKSVSHAGEDWNSEAAGIWPLDLLIRRWQKARCHGSAYLAIGDGLRHIQDEYFPDSLPINNADINKITEQVFKGCKFHWECKPQLSYGESLVRSKTKPHTRQISLFHHRWIDVALLVAFFSGMAALLTHLSFIACCSKRRSRQPCTEELRQVTQSPW